MIKKSVQFLVQLAPPFLHRGLLVGIILTVVISVVSTLIGLSLALTVKDVVPFSAFISLVGAMLGYKASTLMCTKTFVQAMEWLDPRLTAVEMLSGGCKTQYSVACPIPGSDQLQSYWHYHTSIGLAKLDPNGAIDKNSAALYIWMWRPLNQDKRVVMELTYDMPDYEGLKKLGKNGIFQAFIEDRYGI
jgi:hypothetical protein